MSTVHPYERKLAVKRRRWKKLINKYYPELRISCRDSHMVVGSDDKWVIADSIGPQHITHWDFALGFDGEHIIVRTGDTTFADTSERAQTLVSTAMLLGMYKPTTRKETD